METKMNTQNKQEELEKEIERKIIVRKCLTCNHNAEINLNQFHLHHRNSKTTYPSYRGICGVKCYDKRGECICGCDNPMVKLDRRLLKMIGERLAKLA